MGMRYERSPQRSKSSTRWISKPKKYIRYGWDDWVTTIILAFAGIAVASTVIFLMKFGG